MNIAVVDDGGHLLAFSRMDGAKLSSVRIAITKAHASAIRRMPTGPAGGDPTSVLPSLSLAIASGAAQTPLRGGLPILVDGECVGAIGVSNGSEEQDVGRCADRRGGAGNAIALRDNVRCARGAVRAAPLSIRSETHAGPQTTRASHLSRDARGD